MLAENAGYDAIYLAGAGLVNSSWCYRPRGDGRWAKPGACTPMKPG